MQRFMVLGVAGVMLAGNVARAQLSVQIRCDRDTFLLHESIPIDVAIRNYSGRTVQLEDGDGAPWLGFHITDTAGSLVKKVGDSPPPQSALVPPGQTVMRTVDLFPLYDLRARGTYKVQAVVNAPNGRVISQPVRFTIVSGREIWSETVGLPSAGDAADEYRTYSLLVRRTDREELLYVSVKDEQHQLVYGLVPLGAFISMTQPEARADASGHLHVLYQMRPRAFGYAVVSPTGTLLDAAVYSDFMSKPQLVAVEGLVRVLGGEQTRPKNERVMSEKELAPPPPPAPKPKKKWWWPFGSQTTTAQPARP